MHDRPGGAASKGRLTIRSPGPYTRLTCEQRPLQSFLHETGGCEPCDFQVDDAIDCKDPTAATLAWAMCTTDTFQQRPLCEIHSTLHPSVLGVKPTIFPRSPATNIAVSLKLGPLNIGWDGPKYSTVSTKLPLHGDPCGPQIKVSATAEFIISSWALTVEAGAVKVWLIVASSA